ncbi:hypothetical protein SOVF_184180 isoform B [Spinacia oleracea]|nr:hypothetical protein SOVF_184180 isoform B [Spinacia oleracea]
MVGYGRTAAEAISRLQTPTGSCKRRKNSLERCLLLSEPI